MTSRDPNFTPSFYFLQQELFLLEASLRSGLDGILNGGVHDKGSLYSGFFQFSIGLERLLKTTLVIDFMLRNSWQAPTNSWLKDNFGHDLHKLYDAVAALPDSQALKHAFPATGGLEMRLLDFFSLFATASRYYNLNSLTGTKRGLDPLEEWNGFLSEVLNSEVPAAARRKLKLNSELAGRLEAIVTVVRSGLDKQPLGVREAVELPAAHKATSPYLVRRLLKLIRPVHEVLGVLSHRACSAPSPGEPRMQIPDIGDMLLFAYVNDRDALKKKRWR